MSVNHPEVGTKLGVFLPWLLDIMGRAPLGCVLSEKDMAPMHVKIHDIFKANPQMLFHFYQFLPQYVKLVAYNLVKLDAPLSSISHPSVTDVNARRAGK